MGILDNYEDLPTRRGGPVANPGRAIVPSTNVMEGMRTIQGEPIPQIAAPSSAPRLGAPASVPAVQVPWYTPESAPQLGSGQPAPGLGASQQVPRIAGPTPSLPAQQVPWYTPEQVPRIAGPAEAPAPSPGPIARAAGLAGGAGALLAGGAAATAGATGIVAANPDYFTSSNADPSGTSLAANILAASRDSQPPQTIADAARSQPVTARTQNGPLNVPTIASVAGGRGASGDWVTSPNPAMPDAGGGRGFINPPNAIADVARASTAPQYDDRFRAANLTNMQNQAYREGDPIGDIIRQKLAEQQGQGGAQPPADGGSGSFLPVGAQSGGQPPQAPIGFATYGGGTESSKAYRTDGTTTDLKAGQPLPEDVQQFNQQSAQAGMDSQQPVTTIRGMNTSVAIPNPTASQGSGYMVDVPQAVMDGGPDALKRYQSAATQNWINAADPAAAQVRAKVAESMGDPGIASGATNPSQAASAAQLTGDDFIKALPQARGNLVKMIGEGNLQITPQLLTKNPGLLSQVGQAYPDFNQQDYNARNKLRTSFVNGTDAENIKSLNTGIEHLDNLNTHLTKLGNGDIPAWNAATNWLGTNLGNKTVQGNLSSVQTDAKGVAGELAKVFRSSGMSEGEVNDWKKSFDGSTTPAQQKAVVEAALGLMKGRMDAIGDKWTRGMGPKAAPYPLLSKESQAIFDKLSGKAPDSHATPAPGAAAPSASTPPAAPAQQAPIFQHPGAQEIRAQYAAGKLTRDQAAAALSKMGFQ